MPTPEPTFLDTKAASEAVRKAEIEEDRKILEVVEMRLVGDISAAVEPGSVKNQPNYRRILARAHEVVSRAEAARLRVDPNATIGTNPVPMTVLSIREFEALVRTSVRLPGRIFPPFCSCFILQLQQDDTRAADIALDVMKVSLILFLKVPAHK